MPFPGSDRRSWTARCRPNGGAFREEVPAAQQLERRQDSPAVLLVFTRRHLLQEEAGSQVGFLKSRNQNLHSLKHRSQLQA